jgi:NitT/TauT family transport system substrate-binding protein
MLHTSRTIALAAGASLLLAACGGGAAPASSAAPAAASKPAASAAASVPAPSAKPAASAAPAQSPATAKPGPSGTVTIKISDIQITSASGTYIAFEKGYFKEEGIQAELVTVPTAEQITALLTGTVDVAGAALTSQLYNAMGRGVSFKMVADHGANLKDASAGGIIVRKDLADSGKFTGPASFKGWKVFHVQPPSTADIALEKYLKSGGLALKDVDTSPVTNFADVLPAFANKSVDAAYFQEPFSTNAVLQGLAVRGPIGYDIYPNQQIATLIFNQKLNGDVGVRYLKAYTRGVRDYVRGLIQKDKTAFDEVVPILIQHTIIKDKALFEKAIPSGLKADPVPNTESILNDFDWFVANGQVTQKFDLKPYIDTSMVEAAIKQLGPAR